jgi:hypothetical protein
MPTILHCTISLQLCYMHKPVPICCAVVFVGWLSKKCFSQTSYAMFTGTSIMCAVCDPHLHVYFLIITACAFTLHTEHLRLKFFLLMFCFVSVLIGRSDGIHKFHNFILSLLQLTVLFIIHYNIDFNHM